jgi:peptidoglycan/LPS O-acetylase OafA/YrhL
LDRAECRLKPGLHGIRALAALSVVAFHAAYYPSLWYGMDTLYGTALDPLLHLGHSAVGIFFVLSGFLLTTGLLSKGVHYRAFYTARIRRIVPLYVFVVGITLIIIPLTGARGAFTPAELPYLLTFMPHIGYMWTRVNDYSPLIPLWSIGMEATFYAIIPVLVRMIPRVPRWAVPAIILSAAVQFGAYWSGAGQLFGFLARMRVETFAAGALLAWWLCTDAPIVRAMRKRGTLIGAVALVLIWTEREMQYNGFLVSAVAVCGIAVVTARPRWWLDNRLLNWLGDRSYGIYVLHLPVTFVVTSTLRGIPYGFGTLAVIYAATIGASALSFSFLERRFLTRRR